MTRQILTHETNAVLTHKTSAVLIRYITDCYAGGGGGFVQAYEDFGEVVESIPACVFVLFNGEQLAHTDCTLLGQDQPTVAQ